MAYTTVIGERAALERELLAAVVQRSPGVFAELVGGPDLAELVRGAELLALQAARDLVMRGETVSADSIEARLLHAGANGTASEARQAVELALEAHGGAVELGAALRLVNALADLRTDPRNGH